MTAAYQLPEYAFAQIPHAFLGDPTIPRTFRLIGAQFFRWAWGLGDRLECKPCDESIAFFAGVKLRTVQKAMKFFEDNGDLEREFDYDQRVNPTNRILVLKGRLRLAFEFLKGTHECDAPGGSNRSETGGSKWRWTAHSDEAALEERAKKEGGTAGTADRPPSVPPGGKRGSRRVEAAKAKRKARRAAARAADQARRDAEDQARREQRNAERIVADKERPEMLAEAAKVRERLGLRPSRVTVPDVAPAAAEITPGATLAGAAAETARDRPRPLWKAVDGKLVLIDPEAAQAAMDGVTTADVEDALGAILEELNQPQRE